MASQSLILKSEFVIAMNWRQSVQEGNLEKQAIQHANKHKSSYYTTIEPNTSGIAILKKKNGIGTLYSLAQAFSRLAGEAPSFYIAQLEDGSFWTTASVDGHPLASFDELQKDLRSCLDRLRRFADMFDGAFLATSSDVQGPTDNPLSPDKIYDLEVLYATAKQLPALKTLGLKIPKPLIYGVILLGAALAGQKLYEQWEISQRQKETEALEAAAYVEPTTAWKRAYSQFAAGQFITGYKGLELLTTRLSEEPAIVAGWRLSAVKCDSSPGWTCVLTYLRAKDLGIDPTNSGFAKSKPDRWQEVSYFSPDRIQVTTKFDSLATALDFDKLTSLKTAEIAVHSELQQYLRAFGEYEIKEFSRQDIAAPVDNSGSPIAKPSDLALNVYKSPVKLTGPFRSFDLLIDSKLDVAWRSFEVQIKSLRPDWITDSTPTLTDSVITATANGELYAKD